MMTQKFFAGAVGVYRKWQKFQYPRLVHEQRKEFAESRVNTGASEVERGDSHFVHPQALRLTSVYTYCVYISYRIRGPK